MKLRFYAKGDLLVTLPGFVPRPQGGDVPRYINRTLKMVDGRATFPAMPEPYECEAKSPQAARAIEITKRDLSLWPADRETAKACNRPYTETEFVDGEHVPKKPPRKVKVNG